MSTHQPHKNEPSSTREPSLRTHERDTADVLRKRMTHSLLLACAAGALWYFAVQPLEHTYASQLTNKESLETKVAAYGSTEHEDKQIDNAVKAMNSKLDSVTQWAESSGDPSALYDAINSLASKYQVTLQRIEPTAQQDVQGKTQAAAPVRRNRRAAATTPATDTTQWRAKSMSHRMTVVGTYQAISEFVGACERELGASKVRSIAIHQSMNANDPSDRLSADIETVHLTLKRPDKSTTTSPKPSDDPTMRPTEPEFVPAPLEGDPK